MISLQLCSSLLLALFQYYLFAYVFYLFDVFIVSSGTFNLLPLSSQNSPFFLLNSCFYFHVWNNRERMAYHNSLMNFNFVQPLCYTLQYAVAVFVPF